MKTRIRKIFAAAFVAFFAFAVASQETAALSDDNIIDLCIEQDGLLTISGADENDKTGISTAVADLNGDGYRDIIIGARWADPFGRSQAGIVYVLFGSPSLFERTSIDLAEIAAQGGILTIAGASADDAFGESVASGDVNSDGYQDIVIGAPEAVHGGFRTGNVYVVFGGPDLPGKHTIDLATSISRVATITGRDSGGQTGFRVTTGKIDGDNTDDIVIGAPTANVMERSSGGAVYIVPGSAALSGGDTINLATAGKITRICGAESGDWTGVGLATGDINGDSFDDVLMGAWLAGSNEGKVYILFGSDTATDGTEIDLDGNPDHILTIAGESRNDYLGQLVFTGDTESDGFDDIILEAHGHDAGGRSQNGVVYIIRGSSDIGEREFIDLSEPEIPVTRIIGARTGDHLSRGIITDVNGDLIPDIIATSPDAVRNNRSCVGEATVYYGPFYDTDTVIDPTTYTGSMALILGDDPMGRLGFCLSAGDCDGDGINDLILGAHDCRPFGRTYAGKVYILSGTLLDASDHSVAGHYVTPSGTGNNATVLIPADNPPVLTDDVIAPGDMIGVFTPAGLCAGAAIWRGENLAITVWGDDSMAEGINGFLPGERYHFKVWDISQNTEYTLEPVFSQGLGVYSYDGISIIESLAVLSIDFTIGLESGWNMISSPVLPGDPSMSAVFSGLESSVIVKNGVGEVYWPAYGIDQIGEWSLTDGYQVYAYEASDMVLTGYSVLPSDVEYNLGAGWHLIGYTSEAPLPVTTAFSEIIDDIIIVKDGLGNVFWPEYGIDQVESLEAGRGYWIKLSSPVRFSFPAGEVEPAGKQVAFRETEQYPLQLRPTGNDAVVLLTTKGSSFESVRDNEVRIYTPGGICAGYGIWSEETIVLTVWGDDPMTDPVDGFRPGEPYTFTFTDESGISRERAISFVRGDPSYAVNGILTGEFTGSEDYTAETGLNGEPVVFTLSQNAPNPFNPVTLISFVIPETCMTTLSVYNVLGEKVETLVHGVLDAGEHSVTWNAADYSSGIYYYRLTGGGRTETKKMLLVK